MARPRITSIIAKWLFGETVTSEQKAILRASLGAAPSASISPEAINGTAATITGNNIFEGDNTFNGSVDFYESALFHAPVSFSDTVQAPLLKTTRLDIRNPSNFLNVVIFDSVNLTAEREQLLSDNSGTIPVVPSYANIDDANESLTAGEFFWDTTLKKLRVTTA
jgi:hypothetical protein